MDWEQPPRQRVSRWWWAVLSLVVVLVGGVLAGFVIRLPYYTISPGGELPVEPRVKVAGAKTYPPKGEVMLLFVRERARVNVWAYVQARLDPNIDLLRQRDVTQNGQITPEELTRQARVDMATSKIDATKVALQAVGYKVPLEGVFVEGTQRGMPAALVLKQGDLIVSVDGKPIRALNDLSDSINRHRAGQTVTLGVRRKGRLQVLPVTTVTSKGETKRIIGVLVTPRYHFPVRVSIDTSDIGGPSAGLAMTLAIIDDLTPGNLTGGKRVAVTGTIADDGHVGEIGGLPQKAVAAKAAHAQLFIVPKCTDPDPVSRAQCQADLAQARKRSGNTPIVAVENVNEALRALRNAGGDPVVRVANAA
jgi:PDZ domain-containing protein